MHQSTQYRLYTLRTPKQSPSFSPVKAGRGLRASRETPHLRGKETILQVPKNCKHWFCHSGQDSTAFLKVKLSYREVTLLITGTRLTLCQQADTAPQKLFGFQQQPQQRGKHQTPLPEWLQPGHTCPCLVVGRTNQQGWCAVRASGNLAYCAREWRGDCLHVPVKDLRRNGIFCMFTQAMKLQDGFPASINR